MALSGRNEASNVRGGPSTGFLSLAESALAAHINDLDKAREKVASLMVMATTCVHGGKPARECRVQSDGIDIDFASGVHKLTLKPVAGYTSEDKVLAEERNGVLRVVDPDAMNFVQDEAKNYDIAAGRNTVGNEEPDEPEASGAPRP